MSTPFALSVRVSCTPVCPGLFCVEDRADGLGAPIRELARRCPNTKGNRGHLHQLLQLQLGRHGERAVLPVLRSQLLPRRRYVADR